MDTGDLPKPMDDTDVTEDDAEMECVSEEGIAEESQPLRIALPAGASTTLARAATEAEMEESAESSELVAKTEAEMKDSAETSQPTAETEAEMKDSAETSHSTAETEAETKDSAETSHSTADTEAEMKDTVETSQPTVETEAEMKDPAETSQPTAETEAGMKDPAETSQPTAETEAEMTDPAETSQPTAETEAEMTDSAETAQPTAETEAEMKDSAETSQPTAETEAEMKDSAKTSQTTADTEAEMKDPAETSIPAAVAGPSRTKQVAESSSSEAETTEQRSSDEGRMVESPSQPSTSRGLGARPFDLPLRPRRPKHPLTSDEEGRSTSSTTSVSPAAKQLRPSTSSDTEEGPTPAERARAEAHALERPSGDAEFSYSDLSWSSGSARTRARSPPSLAPSSTSDFSSGVYSGLSTPSNVPDEEEGGEEAPASRPDTPSEGQGMGAREGAVAGSASSSSSEGSARQPRDPRLQESRHPNSPASLAEGSSAPQSSSCESLSEPLARRPVLLCPDSSTTTTSVSSLSDSEAAGGAAVLSRSASFQDHSTSQPPSEEGLPRSATFAGPLTSPTSPSGRKLPVCWTLPPAEILDRTAAGDETQQQQEEDMSTSTSSSSLSLSRQQESKRRLRTSSSASPRSPGDRVLEKGKSSPTAGPSGEAGTSSHGALAGTSSQEEASSQQEETTTSASSGQAFGSSTGSGSEDSEAQLGGHKQQASALSRELVTPFRDPRVQRTMTAEEWDAARRSNDRVSGETSEVLQPGHSSEQPGRPGDDSSS